MIAKIILTVTVDIKFKFNSDVCKFVKCNSFAVEEVPTATSENKFMFLDVALD